MANFPHIVIGIPTFCRPVGLQRLLDSLAALNTTLQPTIVVVDNAGEAGEGLQVVARVRAAGYPWLIDGVAEPRRGLAHVRNALLAQAFHNHQADFLAMVDDDEWVEPTWLDALVAMQQATGADVVAGWVKAAFALAPPRWTEGLDYYHRKPLPSGLVPTVGGTGNTMLARSLLLKDPALGFDPAYNLSGGEDSAFFHRLKRLGAVFASAPTAVSYEVYEAPRLTLRWVCQRAYRFGNTHTLLELSAQQHGWRIYLLIIMKIMAGMGLGAVQTLGWAGRASHRMRGPLLMIRQVGKIYALLGGSGFEAYRTTHGR